MTIYNNIEKAFERGNALICYAPLGDPEFLDEYMDIYVDCGVDIIEIGIPSHNPYADGKVIKESMQRSLDAGMTQLRTINMTLEVHTKYPNLSKIWMCYDDVEFNHFEKTAIDCGIDGMLMVGFEGRPDREVLRTSMRQNNLHEIPFVGFNATEKEIETAKNASGYIFLQAVDGVTGARTEDIDLLLAEKIKHLRSNGIDTPVALGFGISSDDHVRQALSVGADGVILGSACVKAFQQGPKYLANFITSLRTALDETHI